MPRKNRVVLPNIAHHVVQRGNYRQYIFENDDDFRTYLYLIKNNLENYDIKIHAYCLMNNHVHFVITPTDRTSLSELFRNAHGRYSLYKNLTQQRTGHLWQARFYSCVLERLHLLRAIRYVEMNPVRAGIVKYPWIYPWSSTRQHLKMEKSPIIPTDFHQCCLSYGITHQNWKEFLVQQDSEMEKCIRTQTQKGLAVGGDDFITQMERIYGVRLRSERGRGD